MQSKLYFALAMASTLFVASCNKNLGELSADNFSVTPSPLETVAGKVPVTLNGRFPEKYMKKKAVVTVTPVLRYQGGQVAGQSATFQGEKVLGNDQEISYKLGGNYTMKNSFTYVPEMQKSELYLTFKAKVGKKDVDVPEVKVADGVIATEALVSAIVAKGVNGEIAPDTYQYAIAQTKQAQIKYLIQQAQVRNSEIKQTNVQDFLKTLREIKADQKGYMLDNIEVSAYASPDGSMELNTNLAEKREKSAGDYMRKELKNMKFDATVDSRYTAEDWEGFQELVKASNIQDKDVILRVLSMYTDPEEREKQIKNLSAGFRELADEVLPELRRARLTVNYNIIGRTDDEIMQQYKSDASKLSVEEMLYLATLVETPAEKKNVYTATTRQYPSDYRAYNNLATLALSEGDVATAKQYLATAAGKNGKAVEINSNRAIVALAEGKASEAEGYLAQAATAKNYNEVLGMLNIGKGNYAQAAQNLKGAKTNGAALAQILNKDYAAAQQTLKAVANPDGYTAYLQAIAAARANNDRAAMDFLKTAVQKDASLKTRIARDLEFVSLFNDAAFRALVK